MAKVEINFVGPWRLVTGVRTTRAEIQSLADAAELIRASFQPAYEKKLKSMGVRKMHSIWDNSNLMVNGKSVKQSDPVTFKDGDRLDLIPRVAGG